MLLLAGLIAFTSCSDDLHDFDSTESSIVAFVDETGRLRIWNASSGAHSTGGAKCAPFQTSKTAKWETAAWSNSGSLACIGVDGELVVFDPASSASVVVLPAGACERGLSFSASGRYVSCLQDSKLSIRGATGGYVADVADVGEYAWASAGETLVVRRTSPPLRTSLYGLANPGVRLLAELRGVTSVATVVWNSTGRQSANISGDAIAVVTVDNGNVEEFPLREPAARLLGWSASGEVILTQPLASASVAYIRSVNTISNEEGVAFTHSEIWGPVLSPDGRWLAFASGTPLQRDELLLADLVAGGDPVVLGIDPQPLRREGAPLLRFDPSAQSLCWLEPNQRAACRRLAESESSTFELGPYAWQSHEQMLARISCDGRFAALVRGDPAEVTVIDASGTVRFSGNIAMGSEPVWRC